MDVTIKIPSWFAAAMLNSAKYRGAPLADIVFLNLLHAAEDDWHGRELEMGVFAKEHYPKLAALVREDD